MTGANVILRFRLFKADTGQNRHASSAPQRAMIYSGHFWSLLFAFEMFMIIRIKVSNRKKILGSLDGIANQSSMTNQW